jgi:hypothetical protein
MSRYRFYTLRPAPTVPSIGSRQSGLFPQRKIVQLQLSRNVQMTGEEPALDQLQNQDHKAQIFALSKLEHSPFSIIN